MLIFSDDFETGQIISYNALNYFETKQKQAADFFQFTIKLSNSLLLELYLARLSSE